MRRLLFAVATIAFAAPATAAELWQAYTYLPSNVSPEFKGMEAVGRRFAQATKNEIRFRNTPGGGMPIKANDIQQAVAEDIVTFGEVTGGVVGFLPIYGLSRLPTLYANLDEMKKGSAILNEYYAKHLAAKGVEFLCEYFYPEQTIFSRKDVQSLKDIEGMKVRIASTQQSFAIKAMKGIPVSLGTPEVGPALLQGVVDGVLTATAGGGRLWMDTLKSNYRFGVSWSSGLMIVNKARYEKLSKEHRDALRTIATEECGTVTNSLVNEEDALTKGFAQKGLKVYPAKPEDFAFMSKISEPYWIETANEVGPDGVAALQRIRAALGR